MSWTWRLFLSKVYSYYFLTLLTWMLTVNSWIFFKFEMHTAFITNYPLSCIIQFVVYRRWKQVTSWNFTFSWWIIFADNKTLLESRKLLIKAVGVCTINFNIKSVFHWILLRLHKHDWPRTFWMLNWDRYPRKNWKNPEYGDMVFSEIEDARHHGHTTWLSGWKNADKSSRDPVSSMLMIKKCFSAFRCEHTSLNETIIAQTKVKGGGPRKVILFGRRQQIGKRLTKWHELKWNYAEK